MYFYNLSSGSMSNSRIEFQDNFYYHIYNRWFNKQIIFKSKQDFDRFYKYVLKISNEYPNIKIISYCFIPNHFHFIIHNIETGLDISDFMRKIQGSYAMYFKAKYKEAGFIVKGQALFEWRFKSKIITDEKYLYQCIAYVNFNALKHKIVKDIKDYPYTSYHQLTNKDEVKQHKDMILDELEF